MSYCRGIGSATPSTPWPPDVHVNKVYRVTTIARVAAELGEDQDWLFDIAGEMEPEDGLIWVYGPGDEETMAFTDFGIESLMNLIAIHRDQTD
jgi:hypothetical protein